MTQRQRVAKPGRHYDLTQGSLVHNLWTLAWPGIISQMLLMLPNLYDAIWLGQLGREAQAAAGLAMSVRMTMISVLMALSLGSGAVVSRYVGAKDIENANLAVLQAVFLKIVASGSLGLIGVILARPLMTLAGADAVTLPLAVRYARVLFAGLVALEMVPSVGFMLNASGAPKIMMGMTICSTGTLLVIEPLLVNWLGVEGAALAMVASHTVGMFWGLGALVAGKAPVRLDLRNLRLDLAMMGRILRVSLPAVAQRGTPNLAMSLLTRLVSAHGAPTLAAWTVVQRIYNFGLIPSAALYRSAPAMVGQNLGAAQPERAARSVKLIAIGVALSSGCIVGVLMLFAPQVMVLFSRDAETILIGAQVIRALGIGYLAYSMNFVYDAAQGGAGDTLSPMVINVISLLIVQVPLAYVLSRWLGLEADGIWLGLVLGWIVQATLMWLRFRQGRWKRKHI